MELVKGLKNISRKEWLMELWLFGLEEIQRGPHATISKKVVLKWDLVSAIS